MSLFDKIKQAVSRTEHDVVHAPETAADNVYRLSHEDAVKIVKKAEEDAKKVEDKVGGWVMNGVKIVAPAIIIVIAYTTLGGYVHDALGTILTTLAGWFGLSTSVAGSVPFCFVAAIFICAVLGGIFATPPGRKVITTLDGFLCKVGVWKSIRKLIKLPSNKPAPSNGGVDLAGDAIWVWNTGWDLFSNHGPLVPSDPDSAVAVMQLSIPVPTGYSDKSVPADWVAPTGMTNAQALAYRISGGGPLGVGFTAPPKLPPASFYAPPAATTAQQ